MPIRLALLLTCLLSLSCFSQQRKSELSHRITLYSTERINPYSLGAKGFEVPIKVWNQLIKSTPSKRNFKVDQFHISVEKFDDLVPYLRITDSDTKQEYYHFLDESDQNIKLLRSKLHLVHSYKAKPTDLIRRQLETDTKRLLQVALKKTYTNPGQWGADSLQTLDEGEYLYAQLVKTWKETRRKNSHLSDKEFKNYFIDKNAIYFEDALGSAELNILDDRPFVRVAHHSTERSFVYLKKNEFDPDSESFKKYMAKQHIMAGSQRADQSTGRDVVIFLVDNYDNNIDPDQLLDENRYISLKRLRPYTAKWWQEYFRAIVERPNASSVLFGIFWGGIHATLSFGTASFIDEFIAPIDFNPAHVAGFVAGWSTVFGTINGTFKNWVSTGGYSKKVMKSMLNGLLFQYLMTIVLVSDPFSVLNPLTMSGLMTHGMILTATYLSNLAKPYWYNFAEIRERSGQTVKPVELGPIKTKWKLADFEFQTAYLPHFLIRFLERTNMGLPKFVNLGDNIFASSMPLPAGQGILLASVPFAERLFLFYAEWYAKKTQHPEAIKMAANARKSWDMKKTFLLDIKVVPQVMLKTFGVTKSMRDNARTRLHKMYPNYFSEQTKNQKNALVKKFEIPAKTTKKTTCISIIDKVLNKSLKAG